MINSKDTVLPVIGLEIHVELATETKMFCRCRNRFGDEPNSNVCPVCIGMPGALPVMNAQAVDYAMKVGIALGSKIPHLTKWDRKSYYYPDLPKDYQISQYDMPLADGGSLEFLLDGERTAVRLIRAHLEEDAGKNIHDNPAHTSVDLNRAGVPLLEIVTEPDIHSPGQAGAFAREMRRLIRYLGVSEANMQMGHMRFEPNINLHITRDGKTFKTPIIEVKNLNSFKALTGAITFEIARQYEKWQGDNDYTLENYPKENRGYDDDRQITLFQRSKEDAHDYRYFPDPDLPEVIIDDAWRERIASSVGELPLARRARYIEKLSLGEAIADTLTQEAFVGDLLDEAVAKGADAKQCAKFILGKASAIANERNSSISQIGLSASDLAQLAQMVTAGEINATSADKIFVAMIDSEDSPKQIAEKQNLLAVKDTGQITEWVDSAIAANPQATEDVISGGKKQKRAFGFLTGQVMQLSRGAAVPAEVQRLLQKKLDM